MKRRKLRIFSTSFFYDNFGLYDLSIYYFKNKNKIKKNLSFLNKITNFFTKTAVFNMLLRTLFLFILASCSLSRDIFISSLYSLNGDGSEISPFTSLEAAFSQLPEILINDNITLHLAYSQSKYTLNETITIESSHLHIKK